VGENLVQQTERPGQPIRFGAYEVDLRSGELRKNGLRLKLSGQPFQVLALLLERPGDLVTREEIQKRLWPADTFVDFDHSLNTAINKIRGVLGDAADSPRFVETLPRRGYRFIAAVEGVAAAELAPPEVPRNGQPPGEVGRIPLQEPAAPAREPSRRWRWALALSGVSGISSDGTALGIGHPQGVPLRRSPLWVAGSLAVILTILAVAWLVLRRNPQPQAELTQKRLTFTSSDNPVIHQDISPDGKYLAYSDSAGIHVKLLSTGEDRLIPRPAGVPNSDWWRSESWFPDSTQLLARTYEPGGHESMWTVSLLGQSARVLREGRAGLEVSPDGTRIAFVPEPGASGRLAEVWVVDSKGDNPQKVLAFGQNEEFDNVHWSPDGQRLGYTRVQRTPTKYLSSLETCDLKGANRTMVLRDIEEWLGDYCWLPSGRIIYERGESPGSDDGNLWQISIDSHSGRPTGKPKPITHWPGSQAGQLSASADGKRLTLLRFTQRRQVYLGELAASGTPTNMPRLLTNDETDDVPTAWTADSKAVLFSSDRSGSVSIFKQGITEDKPESVASGPQGASNPRLSPDGNWTLYQESPKSAGPSAPVALLRIPANGGVPQHVLEMRNDSVYECARAPACLCVLSEVSEDEKRFTLTAIDPLNGRSKVLRTVEREGPDSYYPWGLSPDGTSLAISKYEEPEIHTRLLSLTGGSDRDITVKGWPNIVGLDWSADGKGLYVGSASPQLCTLLYVNLEAKARVVWQVKGSPSGIWGIASPDGRYLAIGRQLAESCVWMLEDF
jgi:DNA-binding winged helix-turn-helix (wHTH) protein/Tol biopolymer transport system component